MAHVKRAVGYVQIALGIMLIFACFVGSDILSRYVDKTYEKVEQEYMEIREYRNVTTTDENEIDYSYQKFLSKINSILIIQVMVIVVCVLAISMILQGVANTRTGSEDDVSTKELSKFIISLFLIIYVIAAGYIIAFKTAPSERITVSLVFLGILVVFIIIACFINRLTKKN